MIATIVHFLLKINLSISLYPAHYQNLMLGWHLLVTRDRHRFHCKRITASRGVMKNASVILGKAFTVAPALHKSPLQRQVASEYNVYLTTPQLSESIVWFVQPR